MDSLFHSASNYTFDWLIKQPHVKEESLTDWLLYFLSEKDKRIFYQAFSRNEESAIGADWEWWVLSDNGYDNSYKAYRFLVQAKKLKKDNDNYPLLSYSNRNGVQMDLLIESAKYRCAFPLYMYYSTQTAEYSEQIKNFPNDKDLLGWCEGCVNGCYLSPAMIVKEIIFGSPRMKIDEQQLVNSAFGLSILDYPIKNDCVIQWLEKVNSFYKQSENFEKNLCAAKGVDGIKHYGSGIPGYINSIIKYRDENLDWIEGEFRHQFEGISGIGIIDFRYKKMRQGDSRET